MRRNSPLQIVVLAVLLVSLLALTALIVYRQHDDTIGARPFAPAAAALMAGSPCSSPHLLMLHR